MSFWYIQTEFYPQAMTAVSACGSWTANNVYKKSQPTERSLMKVYLMWPSTPASPSLPVRELMPWPKCLSEGQRSSVLKLTQSIWWRGVWWCQAAVFHHEPQEMQSTVLTAQPAILQHPCGSLKPDNQFSFQNTCRRHMSRKLHDINILRPTVLLFNYLEENQYILLVLGSLSPHQPHQLLPPSPALAISPSSWPALWFTLCAKMVPIINCVCRIWVPQLLH